MNRTLAVLILALLALGASATRAGDEEKDAVGSGAPAAAWRAAGALLPPKTPPAPSMRILRAGRAELERQPAGKARSDLIAALDDLENGAASRPPAEREEWIGAHVGTLNETLRTLAAGAPAPLVRAAVLAAARLDLLAERWDDARVLAERALALNRDDREALIIRSRAESGVGDNARAYDDADRAARRSPPSTGAYVARAAASYGLGNYAQSVGDARRALVLEPGNRTARALLKLSLGRASPSPSFEETAPGLFRSRARDDEGKDQLLDQAEKRRLAPVEEPRLPAAARFTESAGTRLALRDCWGAVSDADKALALDPTDWRALYIRAVAHGLMDEYGEAVRDASRGLAIRPMDPPLRDARAWAYNRMGRFADAAADERAALEADPRDAYAFANRAYADERRNDEAAMLADARTAADLDPRLEAAYSEAARRHGLPTRGDDDARRATNRRRAFAAVVASALCGGVLIALGVMLVNSQAEGDRAPRRADSIEASYVLGKAIGQGGMGLVYEAFDRKLRRPVAIKMLRDEFKLDDDARALFMEEARTVAELSHPAIVDIHSVVEDSRGAYLVFERLEGRTLDQVIAERRRLPLAEIKRVLKPVCEALEYAHARGVVHRDLKPSNIMLTANGVKVLDFGISRHAARGGERGGNAADGDLAGTPEYMAPEQSQGVVRKENDIYSLGAVLREMATGERSLSGQLAAHLPPELSALISRCLEPDPNHRPRSPMEFWRALSAIPEPAANA